MPISDEKKCQSLINMIGLKCLVLQDIVTDLKKYRSAYQTQGVDPTGTALEGNVAAVSSWIDDLENASSNAIVNGFINNIVPSHKNKALGDL